ncbi:hypothetical protein KFK09_005003 [Dendrobium nobile]|uniref:Uncharacterized protein n=1 Tax=Dendrobium nobile TaxID=94219 RepID=A0A8T3BXX7_DENNO|nr:hypothetical protein KFK09_005003 [Dendrobium nobile]
MLHGLFVQVGEEEGRKMWVSWFGDDQKGSGGSASILDGARDRREYRVGVSRRRSQIMASDVGG